MPPQRTRVAESRVGNTPSNGPLRAQSNALEQSILRRQYALVTRSMAVLLRAQL